MMKSRNVKIAGGVGAAMTLLAAASAYAAAGWSSFGALQSIEIDSAAYPSNGTATYLNFSTGGSGAPSCAGSSQSVAGGSADNVKQMTAIASQAFLAGKQVRIFYDGTCLSTSGTVVSSGGYPRFVNIAMQ